MVVVELLPGIDGNKKYYSMFKMHTRIIGDGSMRVLPSGAGRIYTFV